MAYSAILCPDFYTGEIEDTEAECEERCQKLYRYCMGIHAPHFPVPAVPMQVQWHDWRENSPFHDSITFHEGEEAVLSAIVDYNFDRCCDFHYPLGQYVHANRIQEGVDLYMGVKCSTS